MQARARGAVRNTEPLQKGRLGGPGAVRENRRAVSPRAAPKVFSRPPPPVFASPVCLLRVSCNKVSTFSDEQCAISRFFYGRLDSSDLRLGVGH